METQKKYLKLFEDGLSSIATIIKPSGVSLLAPEFLDMANKAFNHYENTVENGITVKHVDELRMNIYIVSEDPNSVSKINDYRYKNIYERSIIGANDFKTFLTKVKNNGVHFHKNSIAIITLFKFRYLKNGVKHIDKNHVGPYIFNHKNLSNYSHSTSVAVDSRAETHSSGTHTVMNFKTKFNFSMKELLELELTKYDKIADEDSINTNFLAVKHLFKNVVFTNLTKSANAKETLKFLQTYITPRLCENNEFEAVILDRLYNLDPENSLAYTKHFKKCINGKFLSNMSEEIDSLIKDYETPITSDHYDITKFDASNKTEGIVRTLFSRETVAQNLEAVDQYKKRYDFIEINPLITALLKGVCKNTVGNVEAGFEIKTIAPCAVNNGDLKASFLTKGNYLLKVCTSTNSTRVEVLTKSEIDKNIIFIPKNMQNIAELMEYKHFRDTLEKIFIADTSKYLEFALEAKKILSMLVSENYKTSEFLQDHVVFKEITFAGTTFYNLRIRTLLLYLAEIFYDSINKDEEILRILQSFDVTDGNGNKLSSELIVNLFSAAYKNYLAETDSLTYSRKPLVKYKISDNKILFKELN